MAAALALGTAVPAGSGLGAHRHCLLMASGDEQGPQSRFQEEPGRKPWCKVGGVEGSRAGWREGQPGGHALNKGGHSHPALVQHCHMAEPFKTLFSWKPICAPNPALVLPVFIFSALKRRVANCGLWASNDCHFYDGWKKVKLGK